MDISTPAQCDVQPATAEDTNEVLRKQEARARRLANLKPVQPGEIRNPRGRPKKDFSLAALAQQHAEKAVLTLVEVMSNEAATPSARVSAASELLDRGFGRAPQTLDVEHKIGFSEQFEEFMRAITDRRSGRHVIEAEVLDAAE